jgi:hypothetical protein
MYIRSLTVDQPNGQGTFSTRVMLIEIQFKMLRNAGEDIDPPHVYREQGTSNVFSIQLERRCTS